MSEIKLLYFSVHEWGNLGRRKVRLAHEFARQPEVASVLYVEQPVQLSLLDAARRRFPTSHLTEPHDHWSALLGRPRQVEDKVWSYAGSEKTIPLTRFEAVRRLGALQRLNEYLYYAGVVRALRALPGERLVVWTSHPLHLRALERFSRRALACFDWTDDWAQFEVPHTRDRQESARLTKHMLETADVVFAVSKSLYQRASKINDRAVLAPNATDWRLLGNDGDAELPIAPELAEIPGPVIGYFGQIGDRVDFGLLEEVADAHPEWSLVLIGPVWEHKRVQAEALAGRDNVYFLGWRPYPSLPGFMRGFDVCTIPHTCDQLTASMDPIKLYDYMTSGKPIVSTDVAGLDRFADVVYVAEDRSQFVTCLERALAENDETLPTKRKAYAQTNTWPKRADQMFQVLQAQLAAGDEG